MIKLLTSGLFTTIQDRGRFGYRNQGIPVSGAMDMASATLANTVLNNVENEAVMEITMLGPTLFFEVDTFICITGAIFNPILNGVEVPMFKRVHVKNNSTLKIGAAQQGMRGYIAVKGGFDVEKILGSYSQYKGVTNLYQLKKGDELSLKQPKVEGFQISEDNIIKKLSSEIYLEVTKGPEFDMLTTQEQEILLNFKGVINPQSNRMAYLLGNILNINPPDIITSAVQPGTVQVTPSGTCIVLMRDAQTTGGYARVLQLTSKAIDVLSQKQPMERITFLLKN
ncbi:KipI antagonist [Patiriisocius marinistellae]|uniref:KipI antagonist n=1 Tax=Patiriisocius marinistellae TaxID=2494560 RepID=A0A5J4G246_9FLAO|nr:biotin-dependent carboxyltransferase family protein [Patiriisocius marinistellae]GEQ86181.1 KipI antagonist [Patiriisocius marinistellae]